MKYYIICKECGYTLENKEPGIFFCPQCNEEVKFYKIELFDGARPYEFYDNE